MPGDGERGALERAGRRGRVQAVAALLSRRRASPLGTRALRGQRGLRRAAERKGRRWRRRQDKRLVPGRRGQPHIAPRSTPQPSGLQE